MAPTIGVFKALINCDPEGHYHRTRGELGYALKDQGVPDFGAARTALGEAIEMRPAELANQFGFYEFNRAYCDIRLAPGATTEGAPAGQELVRSVVADLRAALASADAGKRVREAIKGEDGGDTGDERRLANKLIRDWINANKDTYPELQALLEEAGA